MRKFAIAALLVLACLSVASAQTVQVGPLLDPAKCPTLSVTTSAGVICFATDGGTYISNPFANGGVPTKINTGSTTAGVSSFNTRSGPVMPLLGDYTFALIGGSLTGAQMPATVTCALTITSFAQDGKGGASGTVTLTGCK